MFARQITQEITTRGGVHITVRKLSAKSLTKAGEAKQAEFGRTARNLGPETLTALRTMTPTAAAEKTAAQLREEKFSGYDRETTLNMGVVSWDAVEHGQPVPVTPENIADLDEETTEDIFRAIINLSLPSISEEHKGKD